MTNKISWVWNGQVLCKQLILNEIYRASCGPRTTHTRIGAVAGDGEDCKYRDTKKAPGEGADTGTVKIRPIF